MHSSIANREWIQTRPGSEILLGPHEPRSLPLAPSWAAGVRSSGLALRVWGNPPHRWGKIHYFVLLQRVDASFRNRYTFSVGLNILPIPRVKLGVSGTEGLSGQDV